MLYMSKYGNSLMTTRNDTKKESLTQRLQMMEGDSLKEGTTVKYENCEPSCLACLMTFSQLHGLHSTE